jgi:hypothetical protein
VACPNPTLFSPPIWTRHQHWSIRSLVSHQVTYCYQYLDRYISLMASHPDPPESPDRTGGLFAPTETNLSRRLQELEKQRQRKDAAGARPSSAPNIGEPAPSGNDPAIDAFHDLQRVAGVSHLGAPAPSQTLDHGGGVGGGVDFAAPNPMGGRCRGLALPPTETPDRELASEEGKDEDYLEQDELEDVLQGYLDRDPIIEPYFKKDTDVSQVWSTREFAGEYELPGLKTINDVNPEGQLKTSNMLQAKDLPHKLDWAKVEDRKIIQRSYSRVLHYRLDASSTPADGIKPYKALAACHNGLCDIRERRPLQLESVYYLTLRLLAWATEAPPNPLGEKGWWVTPPRHALDIEWNDLMMPPESINEPGRDKGNYKSAAFSLHIVRRRGDRFALLIHHAADHSTGPRALWYLDSYHPNWRFANCTEAVDVLWQWLKLAGELDESHECPDIEETICNTRRHTHDWSSGLHVIANIFAFVKFGVLGWQKICGWG